MNSEQPDPKRSKTNKRKPTKSVTKKVKPVADVTQGLQREEASQVEELIKQAFTRFYDKTKTRQAESLEIKHLDGLVSEYLENFMILGYDTTGQKVTIIHAATQYGKDALIEHLRSTLINILGADSGGF